MKQIISLTAISVCVTLLSGTLSANRLADLRAEYHQKKDIVTKKLIQKKRVNQKRANQKRVDKKRVDKKRVNRSSQKAHRQKTRMATAKQHQKKIDRKLLRKHAKHRNFRSLKQFKHHHATKHPRTSKRTTSHAGRYTGNSNRKLSRSGHSVDRGNRHYRHNDDYYYDDYESWRPKQRQHGYRHYRRHWYFTYLYERASFHDRHGYRYGYFSRRGFMFEGDFYRYDREYTYRDRLRGRGLFERRYYRPHNSRFGRFFADFNWNDSFISANFHF